MIRRMRDDRRGVTALEFALVSPIFILGGLAVCAFCIFAWQQSVMEAVTAETARCAAIASADCSAAGTGCAAAEAIACYALSRARALGLGDLDMADIVLTEETLQDDLAVSIVRISRNTRIAGYDVALSASARFVRP